MSGSWKAKYHDQETDTVVIKTLSESEESGEDQKEFMKVDCSQPSIFSYMYCYSIVERADIIARELGASAKRKI